jgi:hypothetical protein
MGTEWYLDYWFEGEPQAIATSAIMGAMAPLPVAVGERYVVVTLPDQPTGWVGTLDIGIDAAAAHSSGLALIRPLVSDALNRMLYRVMRLGNSIIYAPGVDYPIILRAQVVQELPEGMIGALGPPCVAVTEDEFCRMISDWCGISPP